MSVVYILYRSDSRYLKVGRSKHSATIRASDYTDGNWLVHKEFEVPSYLDALIEEESHTQLKKAGKWVDPGITGGSATEVFDCTKTEAESVVLRAINSVCGEAKDQIANTLSVYKIKAKPAETASVKIKKNTENYSLWKFLTKNLFFTSLIAAVLAGFLSGLGGEGVLITSLVLSWVPVLLLYWRHDSIWVVIYLVFVHTPIFMSIASLSM